MNQLLRICIIFTIIFTSYCTVYDLYKLNTTQALCLDGTPGAYYLSRQGDPKKILIHFQGGGWCRGIDQESTLQDCYQRSYISFGSSKYYSNIKVINQGIDSSDERNNFKQWKKVIFLYCDGSGHQGYKKQPINYKNKKLYFRGHKITIQTLNSLQQKLKIFSQSTHVVVSGLSAGGLAVFFWTNYIYDRVKSGKVWALPDSGIFLDVNNVVSNRPIYRQTLTNMMKFSNSQIDIPVQECIQKFKLQKVKCFFAQNLIQFVKAPLFAIQSLYDAWSINQILEINCPTRVSLTFSLENCNLKQRQLIQEYKYNITNVLLKIVQNNKMNGFWAPSCINHGYTIFDSYYNQQYRIPQFSQNSASNCVKYWMFGKNNDYQFIDIVQWPKNSRCNGIDSNIQTLKSLKFVFYGLLVSIFVIILLLFFNRRKLSQQKKDHQKIISLQTI